MNATQFLKNAILLITALTLFGIKLAAQDKITFTWQYPNPISNFVTRLCATKDKMFTVDWGDGSEIEIKYGNGDENSMLDAVFLDHTYQTNGEYTVNVTAFDANCRFKNFWCPYTGTKYLTFIGCSSLKNVDCQGSLMRILDLSGCSALTTVNTTTSFYLQNIDLTGCTDLTHLTCPDGNLSNLDLTGCKTLLYLNCTYNRIQLSDLFIAHLLINDPDNKLLGTQYLLPQWVNIGEELFSDQSVFDGIFTKYSVEKDNKPVPDSCYNIVDGKIIFNEIGTYTVTMTNDAIISASPAEIIASIEVVHVGVIENDLSNFTLYPNPTNNFVYIITENNITPEVKLYTVEGKLLQHVHSTQIDLSSYIEGIYFLLIDGQTAKIIKK